MYPWIDASDLAPARAAPARARNAVRPRDEDHGDDAGAPAHSGSESDGASEADHVAGAAPAADGGDDAPDPADDEDPMEVAAALAAERAEFDWDDSKFLNFYKILRGGKSTLDAKGVLTDYATGYARAWAKDWAEKYGWGK